MHKALMAIIDMSVRLSVRLSRAGFVPNRRRVSRNLHRTPYGKPRTV